MRLHARIMATGKTAAGIVVPPEAVASLGPSRHPPVTVTIGSYTFRSSIASMGGVYMLPVTAETRAGAGVAPGDEIDLEIALDTKPREVDIPADLASALDADPPARRFFEGLSYSNKRRVVIPIESAKGADTRQRRIEKAVATLHRG